MFDVSKQVIGSVFVHMINLVRCAEPSRLFQMLSMAMGGDKYVVRDAEGNPCVWYFLNLLVDTTVGVGVLYAALRALEWALTTLHVEGVQSGQYGEEGGRPRVSWWARQLAVYLAGVVVMKAGVAWFFVLVPQVDSLGAWLLKWTRGRRKLQVGFVMFIFPLVMNAVQYLLVDQLLKGPSPYTEIAESPVDGERD